MINPETAIQKYYQEKQRADTLQEQNRILTEALERIEKIYDWVDDAAGKIAHEALKQDNINP